MAKLRVDNGPGCSKTVLVLINTVFVILGLAVLGLGVYIHLDPSYSKVSEVFDINVANDAKSSGSYLINLKVASIAIIVLGATISAISIIGIVGACCESKALIVIYGIVITVMLLGLIAVGSAALIYKYVLDKKFEEEFRNRVKNIITTYYEGEVPNKSSATVAIDAFQVYFECCGVDGFNDFKDAKKWNTTLPNKYGQAKSPIACCKFTEEQRKSVLKGQFPVLNDYTCAANPDTSNSNYQVGCFTQLNKHYNKILFALIVTTIVIGLILVIGSISSCLMCRSI